MIPETFAALYAFLGLVAPGLLFQLLRERRRPALEESAFRESSHIALTSLIFTTVSSGLLLCMGSAKESWLISPSAWISDPKGYAASNWDVIVRTAMAELVIACVLAALAHLALGLLFKEGRIIERSIWFQTFKGELPKEHGSWVQVQLLDGTRLWGYVKYYTVEKPLVDRELSLIGPGLAIKSVGKDRADLDGWDCLTFRGDQIASIRLAYRPLVTPQ